MRKRLTDKIAADAAGDKGSGIMNDPYQVNNPAHEKNDPSYQEYKKGDPEAWAEGVNKDDLWKKDDRVETNHPEITAKMAAQAVQSARKMEERAVKCIVASQRILPGAEDSVIENQAADLMHLPDNMVDALLGRQEELANSIAKSAADSAEDAEEEEKEEKEEKEAASAKQEEAREKFKKMIEEKKKKAEKEAAEIAKMEKALLSGKTDQDEEEGDEKDKSKDKSAGDDEDPETKRGRQPQEEGDIEEKHPDKSAADKEEEEEEEEKEEDAEEKTAGDNLLDDIFSSVTASDKKQGAKTLSGMVKKEASSGSENDLSSVWSAPPDVSKHFQ